MKPVSFELVAALIKRMAEEMGVEAQVSKSKDELFPCLVHVAITEGVDIDKNKKGMTCLAPRIMYDFEIGFGSSVMYIVDTFPTMLGMARCAMREEAIAKMNVSLPELRSWAPDQTGHSANAEETSGE